jgi:hypothetical protein
LYLHPGFQDWRRVNQLKIALMTGSLDFVQIALDSAAEPGTSPRAVKILERACVLLEEALNRLVQELG